ncbi:MAG: hypothetical protein WDA16_05805 [Candidatus Thermoplasmatota archaeon]|jgi:hypothetical protein
MRLGTALFTLLLASVLPVQPSAAAPTDSVDFTNTLPCIAGGTFVLGAGIAVPDCTFTHSGTLHVDTCDLTRCLVTITLHASGAGLLPGVQSISTTVDDDSDGAGVATACSTLVVSIDATLACEATKQVSLDFSGDCRLLVLDTIGAIDVRVAGAELADSFRVCSDGSAFTIEQV